MRRRITIVAIVLLLLLSIVDLPTPMAESRTMSNADVVDALSHLSAEVATLHIDVVKVGELMSGMKQDYKTESEAIARGLTDIASATSELAHAIDNREKAQADRERARWPR